MSLPTISTTEAAVWIPTIIAQKSLGRLPSFMNLAKTVSRNFDWTPATVGTTVQVPQRGTLVANDKVAGQNFTRQNPSGTEIPVVLNKHKEVTFSIDDVSKVVVNQDLQEGYGNDAAIALAESLETELSKLYAGVNSVLNLDKTSFDTIDTSILGVRQYFVTQKVPRVEQKWAYIDSTVVNTLLAQDKYSRYDALGNFISNMGLGNGGAGSAESPIMSGAVTKIYGILFFESQIVQTTGSPAVYQNLVYTTNGIVLATRPLSDVPAGMGAITDVIMDSDIQVGLRTIAHYDADSGAFILTLDCLFGCAVLDQRRITVLTSH